MGASTNVGHHLGWPFSKGTLEVVSLLLQFKADVTCSCPCGSLGRQTPLGLSIGRSIGMTRLLLQDGRCNLQDICQRGGSYSLPSARCISRSTPLGSAILNDALDELDLLLDHGADIEHACLVKKQQEVTPLEAALRYGTPGAILKLLRRGARAPQQIDIAERISRLRKVRGSQRDMLKSKRRVMGLVLLQDFLRARRAQAAALCLLPPKNMHQKDGEERKLSSVARLPRDIVTLIAHMVWTSRKDKIWE